MSMPIQKIEDHLDKIVVHRPRLQQLIDSYHNIILLGNGGSSAIASHIAEDYTKVLKKRAFTFSDPSRLTCYTNDYGWNRAYLQFLKEFHTENTLTILISSSGESKNIINCSEFCFKTQSPFIILTGFNKQNSMRKKFKNKAAFEFHVDSCDYGVVECVHQIFLHSII